MKHRQRSVR